MIAPFYKPLFFPRPLRLMIPPFGDANNINAL